MFKGIKSLFGVRSQQERAGVGGWARRWWRALVAEVVSTALLVGLGCATIVPLEEERERRSPVPLTHPALAFGFIVMGNICAFGEASGAHMNPAVTLAAVLYGRLAPLPALAYVLAQLLGAALGFGGLVAMTPASKLVGDVAVTLPGPGVSGLAATAVEAVITGTLVLTVCGVWAAHDSERPDFAAPLKIGLIVAGMVYAGGFATGASLNPARSFGAALLQNQWDSHWVYWAGPLLGAALAAALHRWVLTPRAAPAALSAPSQELDIPLNDKP